MCYFIDLSFDSAQNEQASLSIADHVATSTMAPERSRKRLRASSDKIESVLFSGEVGPVAASSSKRVRITTTKHQKAGWASAAKPSKHRTEQEYTSKKPGWDDKLAKCKNALARSVVQNASAQYTPCVWKGKRFPSNQGSIVLGKEVMTDQGPSFNSV